MRNTASLVALALLGAPACAAAPGGGRAGASPDAAAAVPLAFAWPDGFEARVTLDHRQERSGAPPATARGTHRIVTERSGRALRVLVRDAEAEGDVPDLEVNLRIAEALVQVVARDGSYLRTEGLREALEILGPTRPRRARSRAARSSGSPPSTGS